jgi:hypothetical protein
VWLETHGCTKKVCGWSEPDPDSDGGDEEVEPAGRMSDDVAEEMVADKPEPLLGRPRRKKRRISEDSESDGGDGTGSDSSDVRDGWAITGILGERMLFDAHGLQRQYWVQRADDTLTKRRNSPSKYTNAEAHDTSDMPESVLSAWRAKQPISELRWVYGGKGKKTSVKAKQLLAKYKATCDES